MDSKTTSKSKGMFATLRERSARRASVLPCKPALNKPPALTQEFRRLKYSQHKISSEDYVVHRAPKILILKMTVNEASSKMNRGTSAASALPKSVNGTQSRQKLARACTQNDAQVVARVSTALSSTVVISSGQSKGKKLDKAAVPPSLSQRAVQKRKKAISPLLHRKAEDVFRCSGCDRSFSAESYLEAHQIQCLRVLSANGTDIREGDVTQRKVSFMELLGMKPSNSNPVESTSSDSSRDRIKAALQGPTGRTRSSRRPKSTHQQVANYFRTNHAVSISGQHGQKLLKESGAGLISNPEELALGVDKLLSQKLEVKKRPTRAQASKGFSKETKHDNQTQYIHKHKYHFGKWGRVQRNTELVLGVKTKDFRYLNMCKRFEIRVKALTTNEIAKALTYPRVLPKSYHFILKKCTVELTYIEDAEQWRSISPPPPMQMDNIQDEIQQN